MHFDELTAPEQRVLGCLIEKRWTTPDQYPLSLNALRLACNQSTNRDPVTDYDESTVREAAQRLCRYGLARLASGHGSRSTKYRHLAEEGLGLDREQLGVLAVLLLRGPQTPGELKARSERLAKLDSLAHVELVLDSLAEHRYVRRLERRPGQKEDRFEHLFAGAHAVQEAPIVGEAGRAAPAPVPAGAGAATLAADASMATVPLTPGTGAGAAAVDHGATASPALSGAAVSTAQGGDLAARLAALERSFEARASALEADLAAVEADLAARVAALEDDLAALRGELGAQREE